MKDVLLGNNYNTYEEAVADAQYMSQAEALVHLIQGKNVFLSGGAGAGKSHVIERYVDYVRKTRPDTIIGITATTGMAALNIGGETIHRYAGMGIWKGTYDDYWEINKHKIRADKHKYGKSFFDDVQARLSSTDILIIDEVSMLSAQGLNFVIDRILAAKKRLPQIILVGDFTQLEPVSRPEDIAEYGQDIANPCYKCRSWKLINPTVCYLDKSWRAKDLTLKTILDNISLGKGRIQENIDLLNTIRVADKVEHKTSSVLMATNAAVDQHNAQMQAKNPNKAYHYLATHSSKRAEQLAKNLGIPETLTLKPGDRVMITQNIYRDSPVQLAEPTIRFEYGETDLKNGMIGTFDVVDGRPAVRYQNGDDNFLVVFKKPSTYSTIEEYENPNGDIVEMEYATQQYPLRLAYAISIHKSQGQTLDDVVIDLTKCWAPNLGYVALSRVRSAGDITLLRQGQRMGSDYALLVSEMSLAIKKEILAESLQNRIKHVDYDTLRDTPPIYLSNKTMVTQSGAKRF